MHMIVTILCNISVDGISHSRLTSEKSLSIISYQSSVDSMDKLITPHTQREWGKAISVGIHIHKTYYTGQREI